MQSSIISASNISGPRYSASYKCNNSGTTINIWRNLKIFYQNPQFQALFHIRKPTLPPKNGHIVASQKSQGLDLGRDRREGRLPYT